MTLRQKCSEFLTAIGSEHAFSVKGLRTPFALHRGNTELRTEGAFKCCANHGQNNKCVSKQICRDARHGVSARDGSGSCVLPGSCVLAGHEA